MAFNRIAQSERKLIRDNTFREDMGTRGWCIVSLPAAMLEELHIPHEVTSGSTGALVTRYSPLGTVYAPAWVQGVFLAAGTPPSPTGSPLRWGILGMLLTTTFRDEREQETVCAEMSLNIGLPRHIRNAARAFIASRRQEIPDDPP